MSTTIQYPKKLKIFDSTYIIKYHKKFPRHPDDDIEVEGWTDFELNEIHVNTNHVYGEVWNTIWHEIGHVVASKLKLDLTDNQVEVVMNMFALGCNTIIFDNELKFDFKRRLTK